MNYRLLLAAVTALTALGVCACDKPDKQPGKSGIYTTPAPGRASSAAGGAGDGSSLAPPDPSTGNQQAQGVYGEAPDIHASAREAWLLVEISYLVVEINWNESEALIKSEDPDQNEQGMRLRKETIDDIDNIIFGVNETVEGLFQEALDLEPDNPLNLASYAFYLKPRRRTVDNALLPTDIKAFELIDDAIEMDPDNPLWYLLKIHFKTSPQLCHNWYREYALEELAIQRWLDELRQLFDQAEANMPGNGYINYYNSLVLNKYSKPDPQFPQKDELMREIRAGNQKENVNFFFPPPLPAFGQVYFQPIIREINFSPVYVDHWNQFSMYDTLDVDALVTRLSETMSWPEDKQDIGELMVMLYQLGRTQPYDRSFFGLQLKLLQQFAEQVEQGSDAALELAETIRYLNDQYHTLGNKYFDEGFIKDPAKVGVIGIHEVELGYSHRRRMAEIGQGHHKAFLLRAAKILDLEFTLYDQPYVQ